QSFGHSFPAHPECRAFVGNIWPPAARTRGFTSLIASECDGAGAGNNHPARRSAESRAVSNYVVTSHIDGCVWDELADDLLRPMYGFRQRRAGHPDADVLDFIGRDLRNFTGLANHGLQVVPAALFPDARLFA